MHVPKRFSGPNRVRQAGPPLSLALLIAFLSKHFSEIKWKKLWTFVLETCGTLSLLALLVLHSLTIVFYCIAKQLCIQLANCLWKVWHFHLTLADHILDFVEYLLQLPSKVFVSVALSSFALMSLSLFSQAATESLPWPQPGQTHLSPAMIHNELALQEHALTCSHKNTTKLEQADLCQVPTLNGMADPQQHTQGQHADQHLLTREPQLISSPPPIDPPPPVVFAPRQPRKPPDKLLQGSHLYDPIKSNTNESSLLFQLHFPRELLPDLNGSTMTVDTVYS